MKPLAVMNVIPFIDIMLVLLAIVLTTSTFLAQGKIPLHLPDANKALSIPPIKTLEISIDEVGSIYLDEKNVQLDMLANRFKEVASDTPIMLRVDKRADFEHFVAVIDLLKAKGLTNLSIVTNRTGG